MSKLMDVANDDIAIIEDTIVERLAMGVSQAVAQRQAVDEALAQLADERSAVMRAINQQLRAEEPAEPVEAAPVAEQTPPEEEVATEEPVFAQKSDPLFRSALADAIAGISMKAAPAAGWKDAIKGLVNKGTVKADEVEWSGVTDWLDLQQGKVTRDQVAQFLGENGVRVEETTLGRAPTKDERDRIAQLQYGENYDTLPAHIRRDLDDDLAGDAGPKYDQYTLPGGTNYREVLLTLPDRDSAVEAHRAFLARMRTKYPGTIAERNAAMTAEERQQLDQLGTQANAQRDAPQYRSSHWDQPNVLAHIRVNDRTDADGKRVLFVEEIQSDWSQQGRDRGFKGAPLGYTLEPGTTSWLVHWENGRQDVIPRTEAATEADARNILDADAPEAGGRVPKAPFVTKTDAWVALALKRVIKMAAEQGYDRVAFISAQQAHERFPQKNNGESTLPGFTKFYGQIVPSVLKDVLRKVGGGSLRPIDLSAPRFKVKEDQNGWYYEDEGGGGESGFATREEAQAAADVDNQNSTGEIGSQPGFDITDAMRAKVDAGLPLFANKAQTETPEFKRWFGNSQARERMISSKQRFADMPPLRMYHTTRDASFTEFQANRPTVNSTTFGDDETTRAAMFFTPSIEDSNAYGQLSDGRVVKGAATMPVYLRAENPLWLSEGLDEEDAQKLMAAGLSSRFVYNSLGHWSMFDDAEGRDLVEAFKRAGYDSVVFNDQNPITGDTFESWAVFEPTQIKSAIGNNGQFDPASPDIRYANRAKRNDTGTLFDRDVTGRLKLALPRQIANSLPGKVVSNVLDRLYLKSPDQNVRHTLRQMKIDVQKSIDTAGEIADQVNKLSTDEREMVSDIIEGELKAGVVPPKHIVQLAAQMNQAFRNQTDELVRLGMLTQEAADRWRDKYLPRYYASKLKKSVGETWADLAGKLSQTRKFNQGIKGRSLKGRGMVNTIPVSELPDWEAEGWEVRDASYDPDTSREVHIWRDFTKQEREDMDEIRDAGFRFVMGYMETQKDLALGHMYERIANDPDMSSHAEKQDYVQVPTTMVQGTGALRYGKLAGRWVPKNLMSQLSMGYELESEAFQTYKKALAWWKSNKTVMNPVSHLNNFVSNATMAHFAGVSYWDAHKYAAAIKDLATGAAQVKEARDAGLFLGSLTDAELQKILPPELRALLGKVDSTSVKALKVADAILTFGLRNKMGQAYEFGDKFYKYLIYADARANGATPTEAVDHAIRYIFTYDEMPRTARQIRDLGIPFFSYTFKALPALAHTALARPDRFFAPAAIISMMGAMGYAMLAAGADDDWMDAIRKYATDADFRARADKLKEEEYKNLPDWMKGHSSLGTLKQIRLWNDKASGLPVFLDVSRFIPGGDLFDVTGNAGGIPWLQPLTPNNPLLNLYAAFFLNKDPYFGKDLVNKDTDTGWEAAGKRADYLWKMATPAVAVANTMWDKLVGVAANLHGDEIPYLPDAIGGGNTGVGKDGLAITPQYAIPQILGVKARPVDLEMSEKIDRSDKRKTLRELELQLRQARRQNSAGYLSDRLLERRSEALRQKMGNVRQGLTVGGDERD